MGRYRLCGVLCVLPAVLDRLALGGQGMDIHRGFWVLLISVVEHAAQGQHISDCAEVLQKVLDALEKCTPKGASKIKNLGKALAWPLDKQDTVDLMNSLSRHKTTFILALSADTMFGNPSSALSA